MKKIKRPYNLIMIIALISIAIFLLFLIFKNKNVIVEPELVGDNDTPASEQVYLTKNKIEIDPADNFIGNQKSAINIFVYEDNSSIYSAELADTLARVYSENKDEISLVIRPFVPEINGASREAAVLIACAGDQNKWMEMRQLIFSKVKEDSLDLTAGLEYGQAIGLNEDSLKTCLTSHEKYAKIDELSETAKNHGVIGAPTMFIGEEMIIGARPYDDYVDSSGDKIEGLKNLISRKIK